MTRSLTFDTGALTALERRDRHIRSVVAMAFLRHDRITVPAAVVTEWWRGSPSQRAILATLMVEPLSQRLAMLAGEAIAKTASTAVDAIVMASAAQRGDVVYTSDVEDLQLLQTVFPAVRLFRA